MALGHWDIATSLEWGDIFDILPPSLFPTAFVESLAG